MFNFLQLSLIGNGNCLNVQFFPISNKSPKPTFKFRIYDSILILQLHNALFMNVDFNVPNLWFENQCKIINIFRNSKIDKHLHLRSTFSLTGPPESASEEDTCGSTICFKTLKYAYYTWDPCFSFTRSPKNVSEEDTQGSTIYFKTSKDAYYTWDPYFSFTRSPKSVSEEDT